MKHELIARAIITQDGHILVNQGSHPQTHQIYYALPGGHVEADETCAEALKRELQEELAAECQIGDLQLVIEQTYSGRNSQNQSRHELVLYFEAILESSLSQAPNTFKINSPEPQKNFRWLPITEVGNAPFLPSIAANQLQKYFARRPFSSYVFQNNVTSNAD